MLPKPNRLPASEMRLVIQRSKRVHQPALQLLYKPNNLAVSRFAMIASIKVDKRATIRNRIKRLLHQAVYNLLPHIATGIDGIFIAKNTTLATDVPTTQSVVTQLLKEAHILKEGSHEVAHS